MNNQNYYKVLINYNNKNKILKNKLLNN